MFLSDGELREILESRRIIEDCLPHHIGPASVDLRLGTTFGFYHRREGSILDVREGVESYLHTFTVPKEGRVLLYPGDCLLAYTVETLHLPAHLIGFVWGRSSLGRLFIQVHDAGLVDPGFEGNLTLELVNHNRLPVALYAGMKVCQIAFARLGRPAEKPYAGKYAQDRGLAPSRIHRDW